MCLVSGAASFKAWVLFLLYSFFSNSFCLSWTWVKTEGKGKSLWGFWGLVLKVYNNQHNSNLPSSPRRKPKELKCTEMKACCKADALAHLLCFSSGTRHLARATLHHVEGSLLSGLEWASCSAGRGSSITRHMLLAVFTEWRGGGSDPVLLSSQEIC